MIIGHVRGQELKLDRTTIAADSIKYLEAEFHFAGRDWDGYVKTAYFINGTSKFALVLADDRITADMGLNLTAGEWEVKLSGVKGGSRITTTTEHVYVREFGSTDGTLPDVTATQAEQIQAKIGDLSNLTTEDKTSLVAAINEAAKSGGGSGGKDGTGIESITYKGEDESGGNMYTVLLTDGTSYDITAPKGAAGADGAAGAAGAPGIVISSEEPTDPNHPVWIDPEGDETPDNPLNITNATVGQIAKIAAVDASGVPTAWSPVDMPSGGGEREWIKIGEVTTTEDTTETTSIKFTKDVNGNSLSLKGVLVIGRALFSDANKHHCALICNDSPYGGNANYLLYEQCLRNAQTFTIYSEFLRADGVNSVAFTAFNSGNVKQNGGCMSTINTWSPNYVHLLQFPMRGVTLTIPDSGLLAGSKFEFWGVRA